MKRVATKDIPLLSDFEAWPAEQVFSIAHGKTVVLATGGTSRWYFLEHGDPRAGYSAPEQFRDYGRHTIQRVVDIAAIMFADGIQTLFVMGFGGGQGERNPEYMANLAWVYELLIDDTTQELYQQHQIGVQFRGDWAALFERLKAPLLVNRYKRIEQESTPGRDRWLIWFVGDDFIPESLVRLVQRRLTETGHMPDRRELCQAYYGRALDRVDIFISNNKPSVTGMCPPLLTLSDLYFTVSPTLYLGKRQWRHILYDHVFARREHYRNYGVFPAEAIEDMRAFYKTNQDAVLGVGSYDPLTQTWRPVLHGERPNIRSKKR